MVPPDDDPSDPRPEEITRNLRRELYLSETVELAVSDILEAGNAPDEERAIRAALHHHLGDAFNEGCSKEADLKSAINLLRAQVESFKRMNRELIRQVSRSRVEPDE